MTFSTFASPGVSLQGGSGSGGGTPGGSTTQIQYNNAGAFAGASGLTTDGTNLTLGSASQLLWSTDLFLTRRGAANLRLGAADAAAPVAQTLSVQSVVTGTTDTAGANLTITGSQGTGTGAGGSIVFQVAPAGAVSNSVQNALATALTIDSTSTVTLPGKLIAGGTGLTAYSIQGTSIVASTQLGFVSGGVNRIYANAGQLSLIDTAVLGWANGDAAAALDVILRRDAANTLALRNGANAQTFRVYNTTDGTNSEFGKIAWSSNVLQIGTEKAGTGTARALEFQTDGVTRLTIPAAGPTIYTGSQYWIHNATGASHVLRASSGSPQLAFQEGTTHRAGLVYTVSDGLGFYTGGPEPGTLRMSIGLGGGITIVDANNITVGTTTGTKIGTATTQKIGFFNAAPVVQPTAVADATDNATAITQLNALLSRMRDLGLIAT